jgi:hypothetical protein
MQASKRTRVAPVEAALAPMSISAPAREPKAHAHLLEDLLSSQYAGPAGLVRAAVLRADYATAAQLLGSDAQATKKILKVVSSQLDPQQISGFLSTLATRGAGVAMASLSLFSETVLEQEQVESLATAFAAGRGSLQDVRALMQIHRYAPWLAPHMNKWSFPFQHAALEVNKALGSSLPDTYWPSFCSSLVRLSATRGDLLMSSMGCNFIPKAHRRALAEALLEAGHKDIAAAAAVALLDRHDWPRFVAPSVKLPQRVSVLMVNSAASLVEAARVLGSARAVGLDQVRDRRCTRTRNDPTWRLSDILICKNSY